MPPPAQATGPIDVPCSVTALVGAIEQADTAPGSTLSLAQGCTYSIGAGDFTNGTNGPDALPPITAAMTIDGNSATIERVSATSTFRLMELADPNATDVVTIADLEFVNGDDGSNPPGPNTERPRRRRDPEQGRRERAANR